MNLSWTFKAASKVSIYIGGVSGRNEDITKVNLADHVGGTGGRLLYYNYIKYKNINNDKNHIIVKSGDYSYLLIILQGWELISEGFSSRYSLLQVVVKQRNLITFAGDVQNVLEGLLDGLFHDE